MPMTRIRTQVARALVLALLLLTLGGGIANADSSSHPATVSAARLLSFPDDPGFTP